MTNVLVRGGPYIGSAAQAETARPKRRLPLGLAVTYTWPFDQNDPGLHSTLLS